MERNRLTARLNAALLAFLTLTMLLPGIASAQSKLKTLHRFTIPNGGNHPHAGVIFDQAGNLYGTTYYGGHRDSGTVFKLTPNTNGSWTETVLYTFCSLNQCADGALPQAGLVFDQWGNLYGTTAEGGEPSGGFGVVFKLTPNSDGSWSESTIYTFTGQKDGGFPQAGLIFDAKGNLYGTAAAGGSFNCVGDSGCGVVFELTPNTSGTWTESVLYGFTGGKDGYQPSAGLTFDTAGNLYGTTLFGGSLSCSFCGVVFKLTPNSDGTWSESVLHRFLDGKGGGRLAAGVTLDASGNLYGTTVAGGNNSFQCTAGCGVVFQLTPNANGIWPEKVLHHFAGGKDGQAPVAAVIFDQAGNLYGTTSAGGNPACYGGGCGLVFKLAPITSGGWKKTVLASFKDSTGGDPTDSLIFDKTGNLYGTALGAVDSGTVFEITP